MGHAEQREDEHQEGEAECEEMEGVGEQARAGEESGEVWERHAHHTPDAVVVAQAVGADERADDGCEAGEVDGTWGNVAHAVVVAVVGVTVAVSVGVLALDMGFGGIGC